MKSFFLGMVVAPFVLAISGYCYLRLGAADLRAAGLPSTVEARIMRAAVHASVKRRAPLVSNPIQLTDQNLIVGGKQYLGECSGCHGAPGKPVKYPDQLNPPAPQFVLEGTEYTEAQVFWVAKHGIRWTGMYCSGYWDSDEELWKMATFVKHMNALPTQVKAELAKGSKSGE